MVLEKVKCYNWIFILEFFFLSICVELFFFRIVLFYFIRFLYEIFLFMFYILIYLILC